jgi:hypothetical protein
MNGLETNAARRKMLDGVFAVVGLLSTLVGMLTLAALISSSIWQWTGLSV